MDDTPAVLRKIREWRKRFGKAHQDGMDAIDSGDFDALGKAIRREGQIIEEQRKLVERHKMALKKTH